MTRLLELLRADGEEFFVLGKGTNLLIGDGGYRGVIVTAVGTDGSDGPQESMRTRDESPLLDEIRVQENRIIAGAGATLKAVALAARDHGLKGLEFAAGIPGTVGGGLVMNAGAYNGEMKQVVRSVRILMPDGSLRVFSGAEMQFDYRTSILRKIPGIALRAEFELEEGDPEGIRQKILELSALRREKQPLEFPSAGSTFKRPKGHFAGKLIMDAGLRGYSVGGAQVSEKHCGFVINRGGATSAQIRRLIEDVQARVFEESGIKLEREVIFLGEF
jgi:UDP-N-acetylmuramate dehydrogenase